jgi:hypothetical protein
MAEIVFDAFDPNASCLEAPPKIPQIPDKCQVEASFHILNDITPSNASIAFRRNRDKFILESTADRDATIALLRGYGFSDANDKLQSSLFYSVELNRFLRNTYQSFVAKHNYQGPSLIGSGARMRNFFVTGSILENDPKQIGDATELLREVLKNPKEGRDYFITLLKSITTDDANRAVFHPSLRPRIQWMADLLDAFERVDGPLSSYRDDLTTPEIRRSLISLFVFLGAGEGEWMNLKKEIDPLASLLTSAQNADPELKNFHALLQKALAPLEKTAFDIRSASMAARLREVLVALKQAVNDHRAELSSLEMQSPQEAFLRSLQIRLSQAAQKEDLHEFVTKELKESKMSSAWLKRKDNLELITEAIFPTLKLKTDPKLPPVLQVDMKLMKARIGQLLDSHQIQNREFNVGVLAYLRFLFGKDLSNPQINGWIAGQYANVKIELKPEDKKILGDLSLRIDQRILRSLKITNILLPVVEGALCATGIALGGAGFGEKNRGMLVGGSTVTGFGCGALITHFAVPTRNPYLSDPLGGLAGAALGFGLSYGLTESQKMTPPMDGRNPTQGRGP